VTTSSGWTNEKKAER
jgi:hypothetical protein